MSNCLFSKPPYPHVQRLEICEKVSLALSISFMIALTGKIEIRWVKTFPFLLISDEKKIMFLVFSAGLQNSNTMPNWHLGEGKRDRKQTGRVKGGGSSLNLMGLW